MNKTKGRNFRLTLEEKTHIKTLRAAGKSYCAIARETGRTKETIKKYAEKPEAQAEIAATQSKLADDYESLARRMITSISDDDIHKINARDRTVSAGIATDKMRLLREQSSANVSLIACVKMVEDREAQKSEEEGDGD